MHSAFPHLDGSSDWLDAFSHCHFPKKVGFLFIFPGLAFGSLSPFKTIVIQKHEQLM